MTFNLIPYSKSGLEIGCGPGWLINASKRRFEKTIAIDISLSMLRCAAKHPDSILLRANASCLPFKDNSFDIIFSNFPADFILRLDTWREIKRVLKEGGSFVCLFWIRMRHNSIYAYIQRIIYGQLNFILHTTCPWEKRKDYPSDQKIGESGQGGASGSGEGNQPAQGLGDGGPGDPQGNR